MHTLVFESHIAGLDPVTGMGLLVLPDPVHDLDLVLLRPNGQAADSMSRRWFGRHVNQHRAVVQRLSSIGWELPRDPDGNHAWFDAGCTSCCGRTILSLTGIDVTEVEHTPTQNFLAAVKLLQTTMADACQRKTRCRSARDLSLPFTQECGLEQWR